jgi:4'-phosphopantetheinyl transferase
MTTSNLTWQPFPAAPHLASGNIHIIRICLKINAERLETFWPLLSVAEQQRAERFHFENNRAQYVISHGRLRQLLGICLHTQPADIQFVTNDYGKPQLDPAIHATPLYFNLSHSHEMALIAIGSHESIGIDIEHLSRTIDEYEIAKRFFATDEYEALLAIAPAQKRLAFFNCWTRKEAYVKANGFGLSQELTNFSVNCDPEVPAKLLRVAPGTTTREAWQLLSFSPQENYIAALACTPIPDNIYFWD